MFRGEMHLFQYNNTLTHECQLNSTDYVDGVRLGLTGFLGTGVAIVGFLMKKLVFNEFKDKRSATTLTKNTSFLNLFPFSVVALHQLFKHPNATKNLFNFLDKSNRKSYSILRIFNISKIETPKLR